MSTLHHDNSQNYESFFNSIDEFLFVLDMEGRILHANSTVYNRLGYTKDELYGMSVLTVHPEERREEALAIVQAMLRGEAVSCPVPLVTKSGVYIPVETRVTQGEWDGQPALFGVTKDISKIKLSEEKFSALFFLNQNAAGLTDMETFQYIEVNDAFCTFFGFAREEVIGRTPMELGILDDDMRKNILEQASAAGKVINARGELRDRQGRVKHVLLSSENIYIQDRRYRFTVVNDFTEILATEAELRIKQAELQQSNDEKDKFFSILAHDLRSPFNTFLGFTQLITEDYDAMRPAEIYRMIQTIRSSALHLYNLLENLLEWSRIQQGRVTVNYQSQKVADFLNDCILSIKEQAAGKQIALHTIVPPDLEFVTDPHVIRTILRNLITNAVKFTPKGGRVSAEASVLPSGLLEIRVRDNGIGMSPGLVASLFSTDKGTNRKGTDGEPSTGLGLVICQDFVNKLGGKMHVESVEGQGSTFIVNLPCDRNVPVIIDESASTLAQAHPAVKCYKALVVDDDPPSAILLSNILHYSGFMVLIANNGLEALTIMNENQDIALVFMDINMPGLDGAETARRIRRINQQIPIIAHSATHFAFHMEKEEALCFDDHLPKPLDPHTLEKTISRLLS